MVRPRLLVGVEVTTKLATRPSVRSRRCAKFAVEGLVVARFCTGRRRTAASNAQAPFGIGSSPATTWPDLKLRGAPVTLHIVYDVKSGRLEEVKTPVGVR